VANIVTAKMPTGVTAAQLLNTAAYGTGAIIRLQSAATKDGTYANEATEPLVAGTETYTLYDTDGATSTWYRTRFENAGGTNTSEWSLRFPTST